MDNTRQSAGDGSTPSRTICHDLPELAFSPLFNQIAADCRLKSKKLETPLFMWFF
jgi:hypothetical protein